MGSRQRLVPGSLPQTIYPIAEKDAALMRVPQFLAFEPAAAIGVFATGIVDQVVSWMDFVATRIGFTSTTVGFPAMAGRWKVQIQDVGASRMFQQEAFNVTALIGTNSGFADSPAVDLPTPWPFIEKTTIRVTFEDVSGFGGTPHLLLIGYLTNWQRDATAAQAREELALAAQKNAAMSREW